MKNSSQKRQQVAKELDFLNFQFKELEEAGFSENEQESLEQEVHMLENADGIISVLNKLTFILEASESRDHRSAELMSEMILIKWEIRELNYVNYKND